MTPARVRTIQVVLTVVAVVVGLGLLLLPWWRVGRHLYAGDDIEPAAYQYAAAGSVPRCEPGSRPDSPGASRSERTSDGIGYLVEAPSNYDPERAHPLIVVYAAHGANRFLSERFTGLTHAATAAGFIVVYADSHGLDPKALAELGRVPAEVGKHWCIDESRVFFTGHSDGGTAATALAVLGDTTPVPAAIAPSAAGFRREDLEPYECPDATPVMVLHNRDDTLFPGYGRGAAEWWAQCNGCDRSKGAWREHGCFIYPSCRDGVATIFCESEGTHYDWPSRNGAMIEFFKAVAPKPSRN